MQVPARGICRKCQPLKTTQGDARLRVRHMLGPHLARRPPLLAPRLHDSLQIVCGHHNGSWKGWKRKSRSWQEARELQFKAKKQLFQPAAALPVLAGLAIASMFGPLVLTIAASTIGLVFATVAGMTAVALFLPAAFFIGGTLAAFSVLGSLLSLLGFVPIAAFAWTMYNRSGRIKVDAAQREANIKRDEWQAKEYRRQQEELETVQTEEQELADFDRRLRAR